MSLETTSGPPAERSLERLPERALLLDLEVSHRGTIHKLGAVLGHRTLAATGVSACAKVLPELAEVARQAEFVLGHNLLRHDLPVLRESAARHPLLRLPVVDTLLLSPIAFPENPYHRLVKDYKLVRESANDPVADARLAASLFSDEVRSLDGLRQTEPCLFRCLRVLLTTAESPEDRSPAGLEMVFAALSEPGDPAVEIAGLCSQQVARWGCREAPVTPEDLRTGSQRLALAYALVWLRVAGSNSVLPPWVRLEHPLSGEWVRRLREVPCSSPDCPYCRRAHDARTQLRAFFAFEDFRSLPANTRGASLQADIVEAGLREESLLAVLPTGGGKSLCFQLPALVRNYRRGVLTIVISPLQALMKDQVDGLVRRTGTPFAAALYGLLTPPERGDVLRRIRLGDVALLYVSPEQLRNRSFREAIASREIGCWVFDEAHCLSKWGHDFRPDYLYAGRFIREFSETQGASIPPLCCFTATAKRDVQQEILDFFKREAERELTVFEGGVERDNLRFAVQTITGHGKLERLHDLLNEHLDSNRPGSAIVFHSTREATVLSAEYLQAKGWDAAHFHAGLTSPEKKRVQEAFLGGDLRVICATNAFGMGIDKEDVRLVIHADIPGSLENYLQEAGRAGRDGHRSECVLLYDEADCERQFQLGAFSELSRRDIAQILRGLRKATRGNRDEIVVTAGEILRDEDVETSIALEDRNADTKVRTAIAWLERAGFLQRDENVTQVFQARILVRNLQEARSKMAQLDLPGPEQALWSAILREMMNCRPDESLTVDRLALLPEVSARLSTAGPEGRPPSAEFVSARILKTLGSMAHAGLIKRDLLLNAFVRHKVAETSRQRLDRILRLDRRLLDVLALEDPDPEGWLPLHLRRLNQRLLEEDPSSSTETVLGLLRSLSEDGRGFAGSRGSLDLRHLAHDAYRVRLRRSWQAINELAEKRRRVAVAALDQLLSRIPKDAPARADLLVEFSFTELQDVVEHDLLLRNEIRDRDAAIERALMFLHEQRVIILQQGLAVFRSAMTIRLSPESRSERYRASDYTPLQHHYRERILQVHVMSEFARRGLQRIREALALVLAYFSQEKGDFIGQYFGPRADLLEQATTAASYQRIVTELANPAQIRIVTAPLHRNLLILAGPGSGKTRTVVHRCAYLLRVQRVRPRAMLVVCFNRSAATELRRRLHELVDADARGVLVLTYHALALRLLGYSLADREVARPDTDLDFDALIADALRLLRGQKVPAGLEPDEVRDRLLGGFSHILVDEYQDIDAPQYELISALAGRTLQDPDQRLSILAVGDDDQSIYGFRGANVEFIRRFREDYRAEIHHLVENYRSTRHIIEATQQVIATNADRLKTDHPIRIDRHRRRRAPGGSFAESDTLGQGRVQLVRIASRTDLAPAVMAELRRLRELGVRDESRIAVLARNRDDLAQVRQLAEIDGIPARWLADRDKMPRLSQVREVHALLADLAVRRHQPLRATTLIAENSNSATHNPWVQFVARMLDAWRTESADAELPADHALEFCYEFCAESRRDFSYGEGVLLSTIHAAKGTEHDHVFLVGDWAVTGSRSAIEEERRILYVGMTRARETLAVFASASAKPNLLDTLGGDAVLIRAPSRESSPAALLPIHFTMLGLESIFLGCPAAFAARHPIHAALRRLVPGSRLMFRDDHRRLALLNHAGEVVARLSRKAHGEWRPRLSQVRDIRVIAMIRRTADQAGEIAAHPPCLVPEWEVPLVEVAWDSP